MNTHRFQRLDTPGKTRKLHDLIHFNELTFLMEAHDALSAAVAGQAGFPALWASGLAIASAAGFRDANEVSWSLVADAVERMADAAHAPILVDGDSGFGNFNNARLVAKKLWQRGAAGICIEDKLFPKMNSFVGNRHPLADVPEFCGRLAAVEPDIASLDDVFRLLDYRELADLNLAGRRRRRPGSGDGGRSTPARRRGRRSPRQRPYARACS